MGYDERQEPNSSGALVAIIGVGLVLALLGILAVLGAGFFFVQTSRVEAQRAMVAEQRAVAELHRVGEEAQRASAMAQLEQARTAAAPDPRLSFELDLDREGNMSVDGEKIGHDKLRTQLAKIKDETSNAFSVRINAAPECPAKHITPVLDVCHEVGDIDVRVVSSPPADSPPEDSKAGN